MALTEQNEEYITILPDGTMQVLIKTIIERDGVEVAATNWRTTHSPDKDINLLSGDQKRIAQLLWTPEKVAAYRQKVRDV